MNTTLEDILKAIDDLWRERDVAKKKSRMRNQGTNVRPPKKTRAPKPPSTPRYPKLEERITLWPDRTHESSSNTAIKPELSERSIDGRAKRANGPKVLGALSKKCIEKEVANGMIPNIEDPVPTSIRCKTNKPYHRSQSKSSLNVPGKTRLVKDPIPLGQSAPASPPRPQISQAHGLASSSRQEPVHEVTKAFGGFGVTTKGSTVPSQNPQNLPPLPQQARHVQPGVHAGCTLPRPNAGASRPKTVPHGGLPQTRLPGFDSIAAGIHEGARHSGPMPRDGDSARHFQLENLFASNKPEYLQGWSSNPTRVTLLPPRDAIKLPLPIRTGDPGSHFPSQPFHNRQSSSSSAFDQDDRSHQRAAPSAVRLREDSLSLEFQGSSKKQKKS